MHFFFVTTSNWLKILSSEFEYRCTASTILLPLKKAFFMSNIVKSRRESNFRPNDSHKNAKAQPLILVDGMLANSVETFIRCPHEDIMVFKRELHGESDKK